jgi:hypothetical protein
MPRRKQSTLESIGARTDAVLRKQLATLNSSLNRLRKRRVQMTRGIDDMIEGIEKRAGALVAYFGGHIKRSAGKAKDVAARSKRGRPSTLVLSFLRKNPNSKRAQIIAGTGLSGAQVSNALTYATKNKAIKRVKGGKYAASPGAG